MQTIFSFYIPIYLQDFLFIFIKKSTFHLAGVNEFHICMDSQCSNKFWKIHVPKNLWNQIVYNFMKFVFKFHFDEFFFWSSEFLKNFRLTVRFDPLTRRCPPGILAAFSSQSRTCGAACLTRRYTSKCVERQRQKRYFPNLSKHQQSVPFKPGPCQDLPKIYSKKISWNWNIFNFTSFFLGAGWIF